MPFLTGVPTISELDLYTTSTAQPGPFSVGQQVMSSNGNLYRLSLVGGVTLVMGNLLQNSAIDTTYTNMVVGTAGVAGDRTLQVTNGTATITSQQFEGGYLSVYTAGTVAVGDQYTITGVTGTLTTGGALVVALDRGLRTAFSVSATVNMTRNPWSGTIQFPTTQTGIPVGVAIAASTTATYAFVQSHGVVAVLSDGSTFAVGSDLDSSKGGTAGAVTVATTPATTLSLIGTAMQAAASAKAIAAFLRID